MYNKEIINKAKCTALSAFKLALSTTYALEFKCKCCSAISMDIVRSDSRFSSSEVFSQFQNETKIHDCSTVQSSIMTLNKVVSIEKSIANKIILDMFHNSDIDIQYLSI
jgi:hypothetical protein